MFSYLQTVVPPVRMEEYAVVHLPMLTVTVPVGTQDPTARTEVCIAAHTTMQQRSSWSMKHARAYSMYVHLFHIADCSPACQNRGTCNRSPWSAYCDCPSGYTGSYCQTRGMHCCTHTAHTQHRSSWSMKHTRTYVHT